MTLHTLSATLVVVLTLLHCSFGFKFPISNVFEAGERLTISVFTRDRWQLSKEYSQLITQFNVTYGDWEHEQPQVEVNLTVWQSPLWAQVVATRVGQDPFAASARSENWIELMTKRKRFVDTKRYLLLESEPEPLDESVASEKHWHFKPLLTVGVLDDFVEYQQQSDLSSVAQRVYLHPTRSVGRSVRNCVTVAADAPLQPQNKFMPVMFLNDFYNYKEDYVFVDGGAKGGTNVTLKISYAPQTMVRWQWMRELNHAFGQGKANLMGDEDGDDMRRMFLDTHPYLLYATSVVSVLHLLFDFLAFKNDISFWRSRKSFEGLSLRYVMANAVMQFIIILYLANENTSRIVLIPACIGTLVECWKVTRAFVFKLSDDDGSDDAAAKKDDDAQPVAKKPFWKRISITEREASKSSSVDAQAWRFLGPFLLLGLLVYAVYSLIYVKQRNWYSWALRSLSGLVYGGGFIMMTPQLFINYRLKSVTHLPWRVFGYKAMNTFIDDLFAFVIKMPGMHRAACFRDDLVFLVYLYQRWIYRVDKSRANEYGQTFDEDADESKEESKDDDSDATKKDQ